jgi:hypothetical protein
MDAQGGEESQRRLERQRTSFLQRSEPRETGVESAPAKGRQSPRLLLRKNVWYEEKTYQRENRKRSEFED